VTIHSAITMRFGDDVYVDSEDLTSPSVSDTVQVTFSGDETDVFVVGTLDDVQRLIVEADKQCNRMRTSREDAERRAQEQADLRTLSGEHPAITIEENGS
jgi:hypothetical protein